jgi:hypothetical protein
VRSDQAADRHEPDALRAGKDLAALGRRDARHRARSQVEALAVGHQGRRPRERDVDLLLPGFLGSLVVGVTWVAVPVGRQVVHLHAPSRDAERRAGTPRDAVVERLHVVDPQARHVGHLGSLRRWMIVTFNPRPRRNSSRRLRN